MSDWARRLLYWATIATAISAVTGVLLSVPPFTLFIMPIFGTVLLIHGWFSIAVGVAFLAALLFHGVPAWRARGFTFFTRTGLLLTVAFIAALGTGVYAMMVDESPRWVLFVHLGVGVATLGAVFAHARRFAPAPARPATESRPAPKSRSAAKSRPDESADA